MCCLGEDEHPPESHLFSRNTLLPNATSGPSSPLVKRRKKKDLMKVMEEEAQELLSYFNHRNVEALLKVICNTLEMLRKRIQTSSLGHFLGGSTQINRLYFKEEITENTGFKQTQHQYIRGDLFGWFQRNLL